MSPDELGLDFQGPEAAMVQAFQAALDLKGVFTARGEDPRDYAVEVVDASGDIIVSLPFSEIFEEQQETEPASPSQSRRGVTGCGDDAASE